MLFCSGVQHSRQSVTESICPTNGAVGTCKQISQVLCKLFFWISTDPKANTAWKNGQCKGKGKILIHILCPKHYRANLQNFYATELYHIKEQNLKNKIENPGIEIERGITSLKNDSQIAEQNQWHIIAVFQGLCRVELWAFFVGFESFLERRVADKLGGEGDIYCDLIVLR